MATVYDTWHKSYPRPTDKECREHKGKYPTAEHGKGKRWQVRYRDPEGTQRKEDFELKTKADDRAAELKVTLKGGTYIDPNAGKKTVAEYAEAWLEAVTPGPTTLERYDGVVRNHIVARLGKLELRALKPTTIKRWVRRLQDERFAPSSIGWYGSVLIMMLDAAVDDGAIATNPCRAKSVSFPKVEKEPVVPWSVERVHAVINGLPERFQTGGSVAFGCGLRQGEVFALSVDDVDFRRRMVTVRRQVRFVAKKMVFALPKGGKVRQVPLPDGLARALKAHMKKFPPTRVTLPWRIADGDDHTANLLFTDENAKPYHRSVFNAGAWKLALVAAGVIPPREKGAKYFQAAPDDGMHALRHAYASVLLDAGETIKALAAYLGHSDPGFTLRTYTHLMPTSESRTRSAIDRVLPGSKAGAGHSTPKSEGMCPTCALAA
ncbi:tyrosine-type recombinase/integrase [Kitasatospora aureofaciens]|uniref:tyrosine-type recombinase/integrase n=1 Tax=Kitasatospora aureofaciens TaxID=1894 RepID=UPI0038154365